MRHIVLFEPDPSGHRMVFVRYIVEAMRDHGGLRATLATSRRGASSPLLADISDALELHIVAVPDAHPLGRVLPSKLARQFTQTRMLRSAVQNIGSHDPVDHVLIPFVDDYCLFPFAVRKRPFGPTPWSGIAIRPRFHLAKSGAEVPERHADTIEQAAYRHMLRNPTLHRLFCIDPCFMPFMDDPRIVTVPDPADIVDHDADRTWLPVAHDAVVLLAYGYIDHRKAIDRLLTIVADPRMPKSLVLALVGTQDAEMTPVLQGPVAGELRRSGRLVEIARHVSEAEEASAFLRADIVWGYYPGNYCSSGAMVRAGQMGRPLLAGRQGLVGHLTGLYRSGLSASEEDDEAVLQQLARLATSPELRRELGNNGQRHFAHATGASFGRRIVQHLAGQPSGASR
jgi:hypothetical protein